MRLAQDTGAARRGAVMRGVAPAAAPSGPDVALALATAQRNTASAQQKVSSDVQLLGDSVPSDLRDTLNTMQSQINALMDKP